MQAACAAAIATTAKMKILSQLGGCPGPVPGTPPADINRARVPNTTPLAVRTAQAKLSIDSVATRVNSVTLLRRIRLAIGVAASSEQRMRPPWGPG